ncbi:MAG: hypothetical protein LQ337_006222 [Flavoplaca oasis]|nr:MAG: hypothetical protein LQ337_006222 [Flavoplaca oasis]
MSRYYPSEYYTTYPQAYYDPYTGRCFYDLVDEYDVVAYDYGDSAASYDHYADGGPLSPPTVCRSGCRNLSHRIPAGGLPEGATLGRCHQFAEEEGICLTHVEGGCFDHGICERLNHRIIIESCNELGYSGSDFDSGRQVIRVAAGLPPGRADDIGDEPPRRGMPATQGRNGPRARQIEQRSSRRDHHGGHEASRRGPREPQYDNDVEEPRQATRRRHQEDGYGATPQGSSRGANFLDEFDEPRSMREASIPTDMTKGWKDAAAQNENSAKLPKVVLLSKGPRIWGDDILPKDTMGLIEDRLLVAAEAEVRAA